MPKRISDPRPCPFGRPAYVIYRVDEDDRVLGICLRDFPCGGWSDEGEDCPLSGMPRNEWHEVSD
jgi:hypothetical protein